MEELYTCKDVAERYKVKVPTVWTWARTGKLKATKIGKTYYFTAAALREFEAAGE